MTNIPSSPSGSDRRELYHDPEELLRMVFESMQSGLWTATPGIIDAFDPATMTCTVQPAIKGRVQSPKGDFQYVNLPQLLDVPVVIPWAGGFGVTIPIASGDEGLVVFASRCIDGWWQNGGVQLPLSLRMHDLSDGFIIPGCFSNPRVIPNYSLDSVQLRNLAGDTFVEVAGGGIVNIKAPTQVNIDTPLVRMTGVFEVLNTDGLTTSSTINGGIAATGEISSGSHTLTQHTHPGVQTGGGSTDTPIG